MHVRIDTLTLKQKLTHPTPGGFRGLNCLARLALARERTPSFINVLYPRYLKRSRKVSPVRPCSRDICKWKFSKDDRRLQWKFSLTRTCKGSESVTQAATRFDPNNLQLAAILLNNEWPYYACGWTTGRL